MNIRKIWRKKLFLLSFTIFFISYLIIKPYINFINQNLKISLIKTLLERNNLKTYKNQVNILILGIGGTNHEGPNLSDSITVVNYNFNKNELSSITLPRDIWSETLENKINAAYALGELKLPNKGGLLLAKAEIGAVVGLPIHYVIVIDFNIFKNLIDFLGGIDVKVENSFIDKKFPITGKENDLCSNNNDFSCRYETIVFNKGINHMNGETALKFVRSRNAEGKEGTDFARIKRQQKVLEALKVKIINLIKTFNLKKYQQFYSLIDRNVKRDITNQQLAIILKNIVFKKNFQQKQIVLEEDFFINPPLTSNKYYGLWVLIPPEENYSKIHQFIKEKLN